MRVKVRDLGATQQPSGGAASATSVGSHSGGLIDWLGSDIAAASGAARQAPSGDNDVAER